MPVNMQLLRDAPAFQTLSPVQLETVAKMLEEKLFHKGTLICEEGEPGNTMYFLSKGTVECTTHDATDKLFYRNLGPGDFVGEIAVLAGGVRTADVRALEDVWALELRADQVDIFLEAYPEITVKMLRAIAGNLKDVGERLSHTVRPEIAKTIDENRSRSEKAIQRIVHVIGGSPFLFGNVVLIAVWIGISWILSHAWNSSEFALLGLVLGVEAMIMTILVLAKQNRDEKDDDLRTNAILSNTQTTEAELRLLRENVADLKREISQLARQRLAAPGDAPPEAVIQVNVNR